MMHLRNIDHACIYMHDYSHICFGYYGLILTTSNGIKKDMKTDIILYPPYFSLKVCFANFPHI
jgi:hypothetical protein